MAEIGEELVMGDRVQAGPVSELVRSRTRYEAAAFCPESLRLQTVTGTFVVPDSLTSRSAFSMSGPCQAPSLAPAV